MDWTLNILLSRAYHHKGGGRKTSTLTCRRPKVRKHLTHFSWESIESVVGMV